MLLERTTPNGQTIFHKGEYYIEGSYIESMLKGKYCITRNSKGDITRVIYVTGADFFYTNEAHTEEAFMKGPQVRSDGFYVDWSGAFVATRFNQYYGENYRFLSHCYYKMSLTIETVDKKTAKKYIIEFAKKNSKNNIDDILKAMRFFPKPKKAPKRKPTGTEVGKRVGLSLTETTDKINKILRNTRY